VEAQTEARGWWGVVGGGGGWWVWWGVGVGVGEESGDVSQRFIFSDVMKAEPMR